MLWSRYSGFNIRDIDIELDDMACEIFQMDAGEVIYGADEIVSEMVEEATGPVDLSVLKGLKVNFDFLGQVPQKNIKHDRNLINERKKAMERIRKRKMRAERDSLKKENAGLKLEIAQLKGELEHLHNQLGQ